MRKNIIKELLRKNKFQVEVYYNGNCVIYFMNAYDRKDARKKAFRKALRDLYIHDNSYVIRTKMI